MAAGFNDTALVYNMDDTCLQCRVDVMGLERLLFGSSNGRKQWFIIGNEKEID